DAEFADPAVIARREADHIRIDEVLASRVGAEDAELAAAGRSFTDTVLQPLNRLATKRLLRESRRKVWAHAVALSARRGAGGRGASAAAGRAGRAERRPGGGPDAAGPGPAPPGGRRLRRTAERSLRDTARPGQPAVTTVTGIAESAAKSALDGAISRATS